MKCSLINLILFLLLILPVVTISQTNFSVKSHNITVSGTSNIHDWTATVQNASGYCIIDTIGSLINISNINIMIESNSLKSSKGSIMDSKMKDALKADKYPTIAFISKQTKVLHKSKDNIQLQIAGVLIIGGVSKYIEVLGNCRSFSNELFITMGSKELKMTDFGVKPPTALFGTLLTANEIKIDFKIILSPTKLK